MAIIIDLFTRKILAIDPIETISDIPSWESIKDKLLARFGDGIPNHFIKCFDSAQAQPYMHGDASNCVYTTKSKLFNSPMPVPCLVTQKSCQKVDDTYYLGFSCEKGVDEPFPWMDLKYHNTMRFLKSLPYRAKLCINTRSDLVGHDDYITEFKRFDTTICILYTSKDDEQNRVNEPGAPSYKRRLEAVNKLKSLGISARMLKHSIVKKTKVAV